MANERNDNAQDDPLELLGDRLRALVGSTKAARLRKVMPVIDAKVREGVPHQDIVDDLNKNGFDLNIHTFRTNLYRYRRSQREAESQQGS